MPESVINVVEEIKKKLKQNANYQLVRLANGTFSIHARAEDETFHPVVGPSAEAEALYVNQLKLRTRLRKCAGEFVIWDVGLGAGGNVLTVLRATRDLPCPLRILSFDRTTEALAFALEHGAELGYVNGYAGAIAELLARHRVAITEAGKSVRWELHLGDFPELLGQAAQRRCWAAPDAVLFDAFSPAKNPEMWTAELFSNLHHSLDPHKPCSMATYSRSTILRVTLLLAGFYVGVGHATGEKEQTTIAANRREMLDEPLPPGWLERARNSKSAEPLWTAVYRQARLSKAAWDKLVKHPQFNLAPGPPNGCFIGR
jgi:tRNA U34 5-methylaminomethyl-2-thiouridine-forming methyltransferase MnmC